MVILVTGGAGFIGSNFLNIFVPRFPEHQFVNFDKLTYAANLESLDAVADLPNYAFHRGDLCNPADLKNAFDRVLPDQVFHFAAESHVDRSISGPGEFIQTNIVGTFNLLEACRAAFGGDSAKTLLHVSTDEVYGSLGDTGLFVETTAYDPSSPYSASKAASDHLVRAYSRTYGMNVRVTNCSNNYGPRQFPEKLIPLMILNALEGKALPVYGAGTNVRDWLYVTDHCEALWTVMQEGRPGQTYNIGGSNEVQNIAIVKAVCRILANRLNKPIEELEGLITYVADRPGHDFRYAIDASKAQDELGWRPTLSVEQGLELTVDWYLQNTAWIQHVRSGEYRNWIEQNYANRGAN